MKTMLRAGAGAALLCAVTAACGGRGVPTDPPAQTPPGIALVPRDAWGAKAPVLPVTRHTIDRITIHHTGVKSNPGRTLEEKLRGLQRFSQNPGRLASGREKPAWADVPYHYYIDIAGRVGVGREHDYVGDTNTTYDPTGHLLIVLEGNFEEETPTPAQMESLRRMIRWAAERWDVPPERLASHKDYAQTSCPGKSLYAELPALRGLID